MGLGLGQDAIAIKLRLASTIHKAVISHEDSNQHKNIKNKTYKKKKKRLMRLRIKIFITR
jgi:hypothetical protein